MDQRSPDDENDRKAELRTRLAALLERVSAVRTALPGEPRPAREAEHEWRSARLKHARQLDEKDPGGMSLLLDLISGAAEDMHRWRIQLDCGHIREVLMKSDEYPPLGPWQAGPHGAYAEGTYPCAEKGCEDPPAPYREITEWNTRREHTFEADPEEPPDWYAGCFNPRSSAAAAWAEHRHPEPHAKAFWSVTLSCGHITDALTDADWKPEDGISRQPRPDTDSRRRHRHQEILDNEQVDEDTKARIRDGCPTPDPMEDCPMCAWSRQITAYEYVGPLVLPPPPPPPPRKPRKPADPRAVLKRDLRRMETQAKLIRAEMAALDSADTEENGR